MQNLSQDIRFGIRMLLKNPVLSSVVIFALALGIGANSALFSIVNKVLLSPLPFKEPERLLMIYSTDLENGIPKSNVSGPDFADWCKRNHTFQEMAAAQSNAKFNVSGRGDPFAIRGAVVSPNFLNLFGASMQLGRGFRDDEAQPGNGNKLVLTHGSWQRYFGGDTNILSRVVNVNGHSHEVIGVMRPTLGFIEEMFEAFAPMPKSQLENGRLNHYMNVFGRLKPGVTLEQAQADMATIAAAMANEYPETKGWSADLVPLQEELVKPIRLAFLVLHGAVALVLLIVCANVANLLLARAQTRAKEMAIRSSLGAGRLRIARQMLTESVLLGLGGGVLGLWLAHLGIQLLTAVSPKLNGVSIPFYSEISLDGRVLAFTLLVSVFAGILFGLAPACFAMKTNLGEALKESGRGATSGSRRHRFLSAMVVSQVALCVVLLLVAGLMLQNFARLSKVNPGFDAQGVLSMEMVLPIARYKDDSARSQFFREVLERVGGLPGVEKASIISHLPMGDNDSNWAFDIHGAPPLPRGKFNLAELRVISPEYFSTLKIPLKQGRLFDNRDQDPRNRVVIINETLGRRYFPNENPLGRIIGIEGVPSTIVGVVGDVKHFGLGGGNPAMIYEPYTQVCWNQMCMVVRAKVEGMSLVGAVRQQIWKVDATQPISKVRMLEDVVNDSISVQRFVALLLTGFAVVGLVLALTGIYGVLAFVVTQRTHEIGVRMALGASMPSILRMVIGQGMGLAGLGLAIGLAASWAVSRVLGGVLQELKANAPMTFVMVLILLAASALVACLLPALKSTRVDPMAALRCE